MVYTAEDAIAKAKEYLYAHAKPSRIKHVEGVVETAKKLALKYGADPAKAMTASWYHDIARNMSTEELDARADEYGLDPRIKGRPNLSHGKVAAEMMRRDFGIEDEDILAAVSYHTTGRAGMSLLEKVVFLADGIEPGRDYPGVDIVRDAAEEDLDRACLISLDGTMEHLIREGVYLDPDTVSARDELAGKEETKDGRI